MDLFNPLYMPDLYPISINFISHENTGNSTPVESSLDCLLQAVNGTHSWWSQTGSSFSLLIVGMVANLSFYFH